jgi:hypothetical protein
MKSPDGLDTDYGRLGHCCQQHYWCYHYVAAGLQKV